MAATHDPSRSYHKVHPLQSPTINDAVFSGVLHSPLSATMEKPSASPPPVDYDDVFGGPPRFVTSMFSSTGASAEKPVSRVPSFRSSPSPVFELPVFGDGVFSKDSDKSSEYRPKSSSFAYEDIFKEDRQVLDIYTGSTKSRPSSRQMSPLHPAAANAIEKDKTSIKPNTLLQPRSGSNKLINKSPFPSPSLSQETMGQAFGNLVRSDRSARVVPSSPRQMVVPSSPLPGHPRDHLEQVTRSNSSDNGSRDSIQFDDVFGGFPQSRFFQQNTDLGNNSRDMYRGESEKHSTKDVHLRDNVASDSAKTQTLPDLSSSVDEPGPHDDFIEIRMDRQNDSRGSGQQDANVGETWVTVNDLRQSSQLKFKSWKDWGSDLPTSKLTKSASNSDSPKLRAADKALGERDSRNATMEHITGTDGKISRKNSGRSSLIQQYVNKFSTASTGQTAEMEEKELQALLASAWKLNEESDKKQDVAKRSSERTRGPELGGHVKDRRNNHRLQSHKSMKDQEDREALKDDLNQEIKEAIRNASLDIDAVGSSTMKPPSKGMDAKQPSVTGDTVTQEISSKTSSGIAAHTAADGHKSKESTRYRETSAASQVNDESNILASGPQDFVQCSEESGISFVEEIEDIECFLGLASSLEGFQEIEGESMERRKTRLERHVRARERAAKALEEMQQREAELQRQQEEKHRLAETADRKIKQWASGKEGNLRALLSNLQHVLWPDSGWAPIPLSSLIEGSDVKRAYRKATLFIHPDKLQQKSATSQQKYIAERVFDILQEAWKTFNNQELF